MSILPKWSRPPVSMPDNQQIASGTNAGQRTNWGTLAPPILFVVAALTAFERLKHVLLPHLAPWQYQTITVLVGAIAATAGGYYLTQQVAKLLVLHARAESRLALERNLPQTVTDNIRDGIFAKDAEGRFLLVNEPFTQRHGSASPSELSGKSVFDLFPQDRALDRPADDLALMKESGAGMERERSVVQSEGEVMWTLTTKAPLIDKDGAIAGVVGVHRDITRSKLAEQKLRQSEANLAAAQRIAHLGSFEQDLTYLDNLERNPWRWSDEVFRILGYRPGEIEASRAVFLRSVHSEDRGRVREALHEAIRGSGEYSLDYRIVCPDGTERAIRGTGNVVYDPVTQTPLKLVGAIQDVTEQKRAEAQLQEANQKLAEQLRELQQRSGEIEILSELGGWLQSCNTLEEAYAVVGKAAERLFPQWSGALYTIDSSRSALGAVSAWGGALEDEIAFSQGDCWALRRGRPHCFEADGEALPCDHTEMPSATDSICVPVSAQGKALGILNLRRAHVPVHSGLPCRPLSEAEQRLAGVLAEQVGLALGNLKLRETLHQQSTRDPLTGLFNRRYMEESLEREACRAKRNNTSFAILLIDIGHFKSFNDTLGHQAGDAALRTLGDFLKKTSRGQDIACRFGGEEFALVLSDISMEMALRRAEVLRQGVKQLNAEYEGQPLRNLSVSIGVALFPDQGSSPAEVLRVADQALYTAKHEGRDRVSAPLAESLV